MDIWDAICGCFGAACLIFVAINVVLAVVEKIKRGAHPEDRL
jgi:hypothetical protein